jgi:hypothetical protein
MASAVSLPADVLEEFLRSGSWSATGDEDLSLREQLSLDLARRLVGNYRANPNDEDAVAQLGLLVLGLGAAHWGVTPSNGLPSDPADENWRGPTRGRGKHLMSYSIGGIGIAHLDSSFLADFTDFVLATHGDIGGVSEQHRLREIAQRLEGGRTTYDGLRNRRNIPGEGQETWRIFVRWMKAALGRRDCQQWILEEWLRRYWLPSVQRVSSSNGSIQEAFVNARIRNSGSSLANCAIERARGSSNRIERQLEAYANSTLCPGAKERHRRRFGYMQRPVILFDALS